jgi:hypothetical protein
MTHTHTHDHRHPHPAERPHGPSGIASVVSDIGGDIGAAVVYVPETLAGFEIEIRPVGDRWDGLHTAVRERPVRGSVVYAGFFGSLPSGCYELRVKGDPSREVELVVRGGEVAEVTW